MSAGEDLALLKQAALAAGAAAMPWFEGDKDMKVRQKGDEGPVTAADLAVNDGMVVRLCRKLLVVRLLLRKHVGALVAPGPRQKGERRAVGKRAARREREQREGRGPGGSGRVRET